VVTSVDSILIDGEYRQRVNLDWLSHYGTPYYIEGIGHQFGLLERMVMLAGTGSQLTCYAEEDEPLFPENPDCFILTEIKQEHLSKSSHEIQVNPNPADQHIVVSLHSPAKEISYRLTGISGKVFRKNQISPPHPGNSFTIKTSDLSSGIYLLVVQGSALSRPITKKVMIR
ncbi:MAG: T9SS type A sorting domain-containing protein, partial [Bacteroidales bacterium]|nr:T9SS type A sorting domain-containing protein [Bacteroidales bacterium]